MFTNSSVRPVIVAMKLYCQTMIPQLQLWKGRPQRSFIPQLLMGKIIYKGYFHNIVMLRLEWVMRSQLTLQKGCKKVANDRPRTESGRHWQLFATFLPC